MIESELKKLSFVSSGSLPIASNLKIYKYNITQLSHNVSEKKIDNKIPLLIKGVGKFPMHLKISDHRILWCFQIPRHHAGEKRRRFFEGSITFMVQQR